MSALIRPTVRVLGVLAAVLGALAATVSPPSRAVEPTTVTARQLAEWIRADKSGLRVLDVRGASEFEAGHIPSAEPIDFSELDTISRRGDETFVIYSDDDVRDAQVWAWLHASGHHRSYVVDGGLADWMSEVIDPIVSGDSADHVAALSRYFGGVPRAVQTSVPALPAAALPAAALPAPRSRRVRSPNVVPASGAPDELGYVGRRGC
jgi:rhodanese-related sulfurtransferase